MNDSVCRSRLAPEWTLPKVTLESPEVLLGPFSRPSSRLTSWHWQRYGEKDAALLPWLCLVWLKNIITYSRKVGERSTQIFWNLLTFCGKTRNVWDGSKMVRTVSTHFNDAAIVLPIWTHLQRVQFKCVKIFFDKHNFRQRKKCCHSALKNVPKDVWDIYLFLDVFGCGHGSVRKWIDGFIGHALIRSS